MKISHTFLKIDSLWQKSNIVIWFISYFFNMMMGKISPKIEIVLN